MKVCDNAMLIKLLTFWNLFIVMSLFKNNDLESIFLPGDGVQYPKRRFLLKKREQWMMSKKSVNVLQEMFTL